MHDPKRGQRRQRGQPPGVVAPSPSQESCSSSDAGRLLHLDGWRFIAVTLVVMNHLLENSGFGVAHKAAYHQLAGPFEFPANLGILGVHIFFVISGYVIARGLASERRRGDVDLAGFWIRRAARILPPLLLYLAVIAALGQFGFIDHSLRASIKGALFLCNVLDCNWWIGHTWSLSYEEQFYLALPLLFVLCGRWVLPALYLTMLVVAWQWQRVGVSFSLLLFGVLCATHRMPLKGGKPLLALAIAYLLANALLIQTPWSRAASILFVPPAIGYVLFSGAEGSWRRWLSARWIVLGGQASYGIYLWQELATGRFGGDLLTYLPGLVALFSVPVLMFVWWERPLQRWVKSQRARSRRAWQAGGHRSMP